MSDQPPGFPPPPPGPPAGPPPYPPGFGPGPPAPPPGYPPAPSPYPDAGSPPPFPATYAGWPAATGWAPQAADDPLVAREGFGSWFSKVWQAVGRSWRHLLPLFAVAALPQAALGAYVSIVVHRRGADKIVTTSRGADGRDVLHVDWNLLRPLLLAVLASLLIGGLVSVLVRGASVWFITHDAAGRPTTFAEAGRFTASRFTRLIGWQALFAVLGVIGLVFCILPGVYVWVLSTFVVGIVSFEGHDVWRRSRTLLQGHFFPILGRVLVIGLLAGAAAQALAAVGNAVASVTGNAAVGGAIGALLAAPVGMLGAAAAVVTFAEAKARVDGTDTANLLYDLHRS